MMVSAVGITSDMLVGASDAVASPRVGRMPRSLSCLVVTGNEQLRNRLQLVADIAEWPSCEAPRSGSELEAAADADHQLVVVDIADPCGERVSDTVRIAEEYVGRPGTLVVVCGSGESVDEELWARQLGAWLYLPGVSAADELVEVFVEARRLSAPPNRMRQYV